MGKKKRVTIYFDDELVSELDDICHDIGKQRDRRCPRSEIATIALMAFLSTFKANLEKEQEQE